MSGLVIGVAGLGVWLTAATDRRDAAVLFVGLPALLAFGIALRPRPRSLHGSVAAGTTFALLLASMLLREGAICVVLSAPLVFLVAHGIAAATRHLRGPQAALLVPLVVLASLEGVDPGWRVAPTQTIEVSDTTSASVDEVVDRLAAGPDFDQATRPWMLRTGFPLPTDADGDGLEVGDRWTFDYRGSPIVTEVVAHGSHHVDFALVHDGSKTARWLTWEHATLSWNDTGDDVEVTIAITFERGLDPSWWFGPIEDVLVRGGATYLLDALVDDPDQP